MPNRMANLRLITRRRAPPAVGDAALTTAFLARTVTGGTVGAVLDGTHLAAAKAFLNGIVSDGISSAFDCLWITATQSVGTDGMDVARLNMMSSSFNLANKTANAPAFVADRGFSTLNATGWDLTSSFNPTSAGGQFVQNSAHVMVWGNGTSGTTADVGNSTGGTSLALGGNASTTVIQINQSYTGSNFNGTSTPTGAGCYIGSRTAAGNTDGYYAASSAASGLMSLGSLSTASTGLLNANITLGGVDNIGYSNRQISAASVGRGLNSTEANAFFLRLKAYMTAVGN